MMEAAALKSLVSTEKPKQPYPGLRPFEPEEWAIFFGRESMIDDVIQRLADNRVVLIHGASGSGKSSLVRAGVFPKLDRQHLRRGVKWLTCAMRPSGGPLWNLARELARFEGRQDDLGRIGEIIRLFNRRDATLASVTAQIEACAGKRLCILVDQFEELFRFERETSREEAELFVSLLIDQIAAEDSDDGDGCEERKSADNIHIAITMRSEFLGECARFDGFAEAVNRTQYLVPRIRYQNLIRAICRPAELFGGKVSIELAERLIADVRGREDELPLIQHGLMLLWDTAAAASPGQPVRLDSENFERTGGLAKLLSDHADAVMAAAKLSPESIDTTERLFRALIDINAEGRAIRRPLTFGHLVAVCDIGADDLRKIIDVFRADGVSFLTPFFPMPIEDKTVIDISHEALIRCWSRISDPLNGWLRREFQDGLVWRSLLIDAQAFAQDSRYVLAPAATRQRLNALNEWNPAWSERYGGGWKLVVELLEVSRRTGDRAAAWRRLLMTPIIFICVLSVVAVVGAIFQIPPAQMAPFQIILAVLLTLGIVIFSSQLIIGYSRQYIRSQRVRLLLVPSLFALSGAGLAANFVLTLPEPASGAIVAFFVVMFYGFCVWVVLIVGRPAIAYVLPQVRRQNWFRKWFQRREGVIAS
jgi:energy-coupling factor transporter ATP-binding protein EcfA2